MISVFTSAIVLLVISVIALAFTFTDVLESIVFKSDADADVSVTVIVRACVPVIFFSVATSPSVIVAVIVPVVFASMAF